MASHGPPLEIRGGASFPGASGESVRSNPAVVARSRVLRLTRGGRDGSLPYACAGRGGALLLAPLVGPQYAARQSFRQGMHTCGSACVYKNDGECDDGGPGSEYLSCECGTDCAGATPPTRKINPGARPLTTCTAVCACQIVGRGSSIQRPRMNA